MDWIAKQIQSVRDGASTRLDLWDEELTELPNEVLSLHKLEYLRVRSGKLRTIPSELAKLPNLKSVDLFGNPIESLVDLPGLHLDVEPYLSCVSSISPENVHGLWLGPSPFISYSLLEKLANLRRLDLSRRDRFAYKTGLNKPGPLRKLFAWLKSANEILSRLETLEIAYAKLDRLPLVIRQLSQLKKLNLDGNPLHRFPNISRLRELFALRLSDTGIREVPDKLCRLTELRNLDLSFNDLVKLPNDIGRLTKLSSLVLESNNLERIPSSVRKLKKLTFLDLSDNPLAEFPREIFSLSNLRALNMTCGLDDSTCQRGTYPFVRTRPSQASFQEIPPRILELKQLEELRVSGQPIETPPPEVVDRGLEAIKDYWRQRGDSGTDYLCEAKLLVVGEGGAGKTSLAKKVKAPETNLDAEEESTEGIEVLEWTFPTALRVTENGQLKTVERDFRVHIWDFGGQEIYHATHQFFLTRRSLYALVADNRKEDTDFNYWLNIVELLSDGSPLVIVKNERQDRQRDIDEGSLHGRFRNLTQVVATNLKTNRGLDGVLQRFREELEKLSHVGTPLPATWKRVRDALEKDPRNYIELDEYLRICEVHGFTRLDDKLQLSGYLHDLGIFLHFQDDPLLKRIVILQPKWGTDAVYRVLDNDTVLRRHGRVSRNDLENIWDEEAYASMRDELLQLMMRFQLLYPLPSKNEFIAPQLLGSAQPEYPWPGTGNLVIRYRYEFMPKGLLTRLIVAVHDMIQSEGFVWKTGVLVERDGTRAEIVEHYSQRCIVVRIHGAFQQELAAVIDRELEQIHRSFPPLKYDTLVPCGCTLCSSSPDPHPHSYKTLRKFAWDGQPIQCPISYEMIEPRSILDHKFVRNRKLDIILDTIEGTLRPQQAEPAAAESREVLLSYAWNGGCDTLIEKLEKSFRERGIELIRDRSEMTYKDSIRGFMKRIGTGKCVVIVISKEYLESPNCMFELTEIAKHGEFRDRVFPIVLSDAKLFHPVSRLKYIKHWELQIADLDEAMKEVEQTNLDSIQEEINHYREIRTTIADLTNVLRDMNSLTTEDHIDTEFEALLNAVDSRLRT